MKLHQYLKEQGLTDEQFAVMIPIDRTAVTRWRNQVTRPSWASQGRILEITNGVVTPMDFVVKTPVDSREDAA